MNLFSCLNFIVISGWLNQQHDGKLKHFSDGLDFKRVSAGFKKTCVQFGIILELFQLSNRKTNV